MGKRGPLSTRATPRPRRVEFVITGIPELMVAVIDPTTPDVDPTTPKIVDPEPAVVGDVTVGVPTGPAPPPVVRTRPNFEQDRRSRFYPLASSTVRSATAPDELWVSRTSTWPAEWIGAATLEEVEFDGQIESIVEEGTVRSAPPFTAVRLDREPGFRVRLGDLLQIFRPARVNPELGVVLRPVGVLSVTRVAPNGVEGVVEEVYAFVHSGDFVRPAPAHDLRPGETPAMVTNRTTAAVIEFGEIHQLYGLREVTVLDKGSRDGVDIDDEYVAFSGDGSTEDIIGRLRVVLTEEETSSAEIVTLEGPVFQVGTTAYLDRKMR
jgi:hypothetical protein